MPGFKDLSEQEILDIFARNFTIASILRELGLHGNGSGNYRTAHKLISKYNIDTSHFTGCAHLTGKSHNYNPGLPIESILVENSTYSSTHTLKKRLVKSEILKDECAICNISHWLGQKLSLQLDHINGINNDNRIENLRLLCPNCHSQTSTFAGKNKKGNPVKTKRKRASLYKGSVCESCGKPTTLKYTKCKKCAVTIKTKINWPSHQSLLNMVEKTSYSETARILCVSNTAVKKRLLNYKKS